MNNLGGMASYVGHIDFKESGKEGILRNIPQNQT
jgi:hypothetical protein